MSAEESNQFNVQGYNIVTILKRLEAATSRIEDITIFQEEARKEKLEGVKEKEKLEVAKGESGKNQVANEPAVVEPVKSEAKSEVKSKSVTAFEQFYKSNIEPFVKSSNEIDPVVGQIANLFGEAFKAQIDFLKVVSAAKKPDLSDPKFLEALSPVQQKIEQIIEIKDKGRRSDYFNHLNTVSEGAPVLGWVVTETPVSLISEFKDSARFWSDRVMKAYKEKDEKHVEWVKQFLNIFEELKAYVKEFHTKGPSWNPQGTTIGEALANISSSGEKAASASGSGGAAPPPPPPPPPPASIFESNEAAAEPASGGMNAVFADLNKGENITSGLKKVDRSEMTHKNPALRQAQPVAAKKPAPPKKPSSLSSKEPPKKKPAHTTLVDGTKWVVENYTEADITGQKPIVINAEMHQSIYIGNCNGVTIQIKGKANAISISETKSTGVVVDSLISGIDIIKSFKFGLQIVGVVPLVSVDKSDEGSIYLSKESIEADTQIFTSSTTALNVNVPDADDYTERAIPEQFKHSIKNGKVISEVVEHAG